jgi:hypothetical protein
VLACKKQKGKAAAIHSTARYISFSSFKLFRLVLNVVVLKMNNGISISPLE